MGALGAEQVLNRLEGETGPARRVVLPTRLVPRGSGERPPTSPPTAKPARSRA
jgi:LacI family transcriptional regulator